MYVVVGGLLAVMYTDAFQGGVMIVGMSLILVITFSLLGGVDHAIAALTALKSQVPVAQLGSLPASGWLGWTSMPDLGSTIWLKMITTIIMGVGIGVLAQPQLIVRFMTAKDSKALNRAIPIGAVFILLTTGVAYTVGALTNVYFWNNGGTISTAAEVAKYGAPLNTDKIMPLYINASMPDIVIVLFMLTLLAAAMSTLSSIFHTMGSAAGHDVWRHFKTSRLMPKSKRCELEACSSLRANKVGAGIMILASVGLAFLMPPSIIARATAMFMGLCAAAFLPLFTHALFSKKVSLLAAKMSLLVGTISWFVWTAFVHIAESQPLGICKALFGSDSLLAGTSWTVVDSLVIAIPLSILALFIGWYIEKQKNTLQPELA